MSVSTVLSGAMGVILHILPSITMEAEGIGYDLFNSRMDTIWYKIKGGKKMLLTSEIEGGTKVFDL